MKTFLRNAFLLLIISIRSMCQTGVGIGIVDPDNSAILHLSSTTQGLLIPVMSHNQMVNLQTPAEGLLVYNSVRKRIVFWNGSEWMALNVMERVVPDVVDTDNTHVTHAGNLSVAGNLSATGSYGTINATAVNVNGTVTATNYALNSTGNGPVPKGGIIMWSGTTIPSGWALCNGANNTPNLSGRFIVGYDALNPDYNDPGNKSQQGGAEPESGGVASVVLNVGQMPNHNHTITTGGDATIDNNPNGYIKARQNGDGLVNSAIVTGGTGGVEVQLYDTNGQKCFGPNNPPGCNPNFGNPIGPPTYPTQPFDNRPPYYVLAYIMKL